MQCKMNIVRLVFSLGLTISFSVVSECTPIYTPYVHGGVEAQPGDFPWMVSVHALGGSTYSHVCAGTIIDPYHILTVAHCVVWYPPNPNMFRVVAGSLSLTHDNLMESNKQIVGVTNFTMHEDYIALGMFYDLAVLKLQEPLKMTQWVYPAQMPPNKIQTTGNCEIAGWGSTEYSGGELSDILIKAEVPTVAKPQCQDVYPSTFDHETQMCAGKADGGVDMCMGDTGGALICNDTGYRYFAGVASSGYYCGRPEKPGVYMEVASFIDWIQRVCSDQNVSAPEAPISDDDHTEDSQDDILNEEEIPVEHGC